MQAEGALVSAGNLKHFREKGTTVSFFVGPPEAERPVQMPEKRAVLAYKSGWEGTVDWG